MAGSIVTAGKADRRPKWDKVRLMRTVLAWEFVLLWMNIDPDNPPVEIVSFVRGDTPRFEPYDRRPAREALLQEFKDRMEVVLSSLAELADGAPPEKGTRRSLFNTVLDLRKGAAFFAGTAWGAPPEFLAMAGEEIAKTTDRPRSEKRTDPAIATVKARSKNRLEHMSRFFDDVYEAANQDDFNLGSGNDRKPLPFSRDDLRAEFLKRYPEREIAQATFNDDLPKISVKVKSGRKSRDIRYLKMLLANKN